MYTPVGGRLLGVIGGSALWLCMLISGEKVIEFDECKLFLGTITLADSTIHPIRPLFFGPTLWESVMKRIGNKRCNQYGL